MSEFIAIMGASGNEYTVCEHTTARVIAGEVEAVRPRLAFALESLGYTVVSDSPLHARRARKKDIIRADFDDHPRRLAVGLRKAGEAATQVTFDFVVSHGSCVTTKGDLLTLEREADALVALAQSTPASGLCRSCGTENGGDFRFCRHCGAPNAAGAPAEVEMLRLTAASRAGLQEVVAGLSIAVLGLAGALAMILLSVKPKVVNIGWSILVISQAIGWWMTLYGVLRIHGALNRRPGAKVLPAPAAAAPPPQFAPAGEAALPPAHFSVTEGTTALLGSRRSERGRVHARREHGDTSPIN